VKIYRVRLLSRIKKGFVQYFVKASSKAEAIRIAQQKNKKHE